MDITNIQFVLMSERAISLEWEGGINEQLLDTLLVAKAHIYKHKKEKLVEIVNTYHSLLLKYKTVIKNLEEEKESLKELLNDASGVLNNEKKLYRLPVCYDKELGWDLEALTKEKEMDEETFIQLHSESIYTVYFIGFLPGFPYLGGLSEELFADRKKTPRKKIPKGAVGIGGKQTGIYPSPSPGGWQIIGNCPVPLFNPKWETPALLKPADKIKFFPVSLKEYEQIQNRIKKDSYQIKQKVWE